MSERVIDLKRTDDIKKDHTKYIHTITMEYPYANVVSMKASWREALEKNAEWLEIFNDRLNDSISVGVAKLEEEAENAKKEIEEGLAASDEELFKKYKKKHIEYIKEMKEFVKGLDDRKKQYELEVKKQMEGYKKQVMEDTKQKRDALKLWADK